jgi:hypothetical protein
MEFNVNSKLHVRAGRNRDCVLILHPWCSRKAWKAAFNWAWIKNCSKTVGSSAVFTMTRRRHPDWLIALSKALGFRCHVCGFRSSAR